jgi:hypothetical protein
MKRLILILLVLVLSSYTVFAAEATSTACGTVSSDLTLTSDISASGRCLGKYF